MKAERIHILNSFSEYFRNAEETGQLDAKTAHQAFSNVAQILDELDDIETARA